MLLMTFGLSIFAIVQRNHVTIGLVLLNWMLIADSIAIVVVGVYVHAALDIRDLFERIVRVEGLGHIIVELILLMPVGGRHDDERDRRGRVLRLFFLSDGGVKIAKAVT